MSNPASATVPPPPKGPWARYRRLSLGVKILIWMALGVGVGIVFGERAAVVQPLGDIFIRLLLMAAIPLVFFNLVAGIATLTDVRMLGRLGVRVMAFYMVTTLIALSLGLIVTNLLSPGANMTLRGDVPQNFGQMPTVRSVVLDLIPANVAQAFAEGKVAQLVVFAVFVGVALLLLPAQHRGPVERGFSAGAELLRKVVGIVLMFGPIGIGALTASTVGTYGARLFGPLALFVGGVWTAQIAMIVVYLTLLRIFTRMSPLEFLRLTGPLYATTAATCSSMASMVMSLDIAEKKLRLPKSIYSFTIPLGTQVNKDGTSIFLSSLLLFTAQAAGVQFGAGTIVTILLLGLLLSEGTGGVPGSGVVIGLIFVQAFNLPLEIATITAGIYRLIDMGTTTVNCMGDLVGTKIVAHFEGGSDKPAVGAGS